MVNTMMTHAVLIDTHCHIDHYPHPHAIIRTLDQTNIIAIAVTNSPSAFLQWQPHIAHERHLRLALGAHPLEATLSEHDWYLFQHSLNHTRYISEVGLDFSPATRQTREDQVEAFRRVLSMVAGKDKILSVHSRRAEAVVLQLLHEYAVEPVIFHWYSGPLKLLDQLLETKHYCSFNPAMIHSAHGQTILARVPKERVLVETDGPYVRIGQRPATPLDAQLVYTYLARSWKQPLSAVVDHVYNNFVTLTSPEHHDR
jgi:TatD DNase family protein